MKPTQQVNTYSGVPLWRQIADAISEQIRAGDLVIGDAMPSYRTIALRWNVGPSTAMSALADLRRRGLISSERGQASKVMRTPHVVRMSSDRYHHGDDRSPVAADLDRDNHSSTISGHATVEAASRHLAKRLGIAEDDEVSRVDYYWEDENGPIQRSTQWEPLALTRGTSAEIPPEDGDPHVIDRMDTIGQHVTSVREQYLSRMPTAAESEELQLEEGVPVLHIQRTHYVDQQAVETADIALRGDRTIVVVDHLVGGDV